MNFKFEGLIGYYFKDKAFSQLEFIAPTRNKKLDFDKTGLPEICLNKEISSVRWVGHLIPAATDEYTIFTDTSDCIIQVDDTLLVNSSLKPASITLEADRQYKIRIEQQLSESVPLKDYQGAVLFWKSESLEAEIISDTYLKNPDYSDVSEENDIVPDTNFFAAKKTMARSASAAADDTRDSDRDGIPDSFETEGYTVINLVVTKWSDDLAAQGYKKYVSNPYKARTANDPYTDYEKVSGRIDPSVSFIARNPLVAAYPIIGVQMENLVISKNSTITGQTGNSMSKSTSYSSTYSNTIGASISGGLSLGIIPTFTMSASANYSHTYQSTNTVSDTSSQSFTQGLSINTGETAYINPNIRYYNSGTAPVYNVSPNTTIVIGDESIATIQPNQNQIGSYLNPENYYPHQGLSPLALNTLDQFSSRLIPINYNQLQTIDNGGAIKLSTAQFTGQFAKLDINGNLVTSGNDWGPYLGTTESSTASFTLDMHNTIKQVRIAARNAADPNDATPVLTVREAMKLALDIEETNGSFYFEGMAIPDSSIVNVYLDKATETQFIAQLNGTGNKNYLNCVIRPGMNILITVRPKENELVSLIYAIGNKRYVNASNITGLYDPQDRALTKSFSYTVKNVPAGRYLLRLTVQCNFAFNTKSQFDTNAVLSKSNGSGYYICDFYNTINQNKESIRIKFDFDLYEHDYYAYVQMVELLYLG